MFKPQVAGNFQQSFSFPSVQRTKELNQWLQSRETTTDFVLISLDCILDTIKNSKLLTAKRFGCSFEGRERFAQIVALAPQQSLESMELLSLGLTTNYLLNELVLVGSPQQIARTTPSTNSIREIIKSGATKSLFLFRERILEQQEETHLYLSSDKGGGRLIKRLSRRVYHEKST